MRSFNVHLLFAIILSLALGFSFVTIGCFDDDDDDDDDDDNAPAGNSSCDLECYAYGIEQTTICDIGHYSCLHNCAPTDAACQGVCDDDWQICVNTVEGQVRDCAEKCAGCLLTFHNCFDTAMNDLDTCWTGCAGNTTCQNNCNNQFNTDLTACITALDTCYSWFNWSCQEKEVNAWNTCAQNCDTLPDYNEKWNCYITCTETYETATKKCVGL